MIVVSMSVFNDDIIQGQPCANSPMPSGTFLDRTIEYTYPGIHTYTLCGRDFSQKMSKFFKTAFLTLGMDMLTITMVKHDS